MNKAQQTQVQQAENDLEQWLTAHAESGVPELVLTTLLRAYADEIESLGYIPRNGLSVALLTGDTHDD